MTAVDAPEDGIRDACDEPVGDTVSDDNAAVLVKRAGHLGKRLARSGMTPEPTVQDEAANNSDESPADGIQGDHAYQQECEYQHGCAALPLAVSPRDHNSGNAD